jgi:hypothetical protein
MIHCKAVIGYWLTFKAVIFIHGMAVSVHYIETVPYIQPTSYLSSRDHFWENATSAWSLLLRLVYCCGEDHAEL